MVVQKDQKVLNKSNHIEPKVAVNIFYNYSLDDSEVNTRLGSSLSEIWRYAYEYN